MTRLGLAVMIVCAPACYVVAAGWVGFPLSTNQNVWTYPGTNNPMQQLWYAAEERNIVGLGDGVLQNPIFIDDQVVIDIGRTTDVSIVTNVIGTYTNVSTFTNYYDVTLTYDARYYPLPWSNNPINVFIHTNLAGDTVTNRTFLKYYDSQDTIFREIQERLFYESEDGGGDEAKIKYFVRTNYMDASGTFESEWFQKVTNSSGIRPLQVFPMYDRASLFLDAAVGFVTNQTTNTTWLYNNEGLLVEDGFSWYTVQTNATPDYLMAELHCTTNADKWVWAYTGQVWALPVFYMTPDETIYPALHYAGTGTTGKVYIEGSAMVRPFAGSGGNGHPSYTITTTNELVTITGTGVYALTEPFVSVSTFTSSVNGAAGEYIAVAWTNTLDLYGALWQDAPYLSTVPYDELKRIFDKCVWTDAEGTWRAFGGANNQYEWEDTSTNSWSEAKSNCEADTPTITTSHNPPATWTWGKYNFTTRQETNAVYTNPPGQTVTIETWTARALARKSVIETSVKGGSNFNYNADYYYKFWNKPLDGATYAATFTNYTGNTNIHWVYFYETVAHVSNAVATSSPQGQVSFPTGIWAADPDNGTNNNSRLKGETKDDNLPTLFRFDKAGGFTYYE